MPKTLQFSTPKAESMRTWRLEDSIELYNVRNWGEGFFSVNAAGDLEVRPCGENGPALDMKELVEQLHRRGIALPILIRFSDILRKRIDQLNTAFANSIAEYAYQGRYMGVYPIKVNQQRQIVEEIISYGRKYQFGLEAGSKPELLAALALIDSNESLIVCNGYKDPEYVEMLLLAAKLGRRIIPVIEKFSELALVFDMAERLGVKPMIGVRIKPTARGAGRWEGSAGDRSKFGLSATELVAALEYLRNVNRLECLQLLHFHLGSQITNIRAIKEGLAEACRIFIELRQAGAPLSYFDVGGGLAVDYDGSRTNFGSSANYTLQEYANDVVAAVLEACEPDSLEHPTLVSESGRAIVAHHSVLVFDVLGSSELASTEPPKELPEEAHQVLHNLQEVIQTLSRKNFQEAYHDLLHYREEALSLFNLGYLTLEQRSQAESLFWAGCQSILRVVRELDYVPDEMEGLERAMSDTYFCNFSTFQSVPDFWAVQQLFPVMPIHRLNEEPTRRGTLADITCDSDGRMDRFIDLRDVKSVLELHPVNGQQYLMGVFLTGAYQEILGDLHNLFGDTNVVHVRLDEQGGYVIQQVVKGDTVHEVLAYVEYNPEQLLSRLRQYVESAVRQGRLTYEESGYLISRYERGLAGYTYLQPTGAPLSQRLMP
jgi:arginine decarboxylase